MKKQLLVLVGMCIVALAGCGTGTDGTTGNGAVVEPTVTLSTPIPIIVAKNPSKIGEVGGYCDITGACMAYFILENWAGEMVASDGTVQLYVSEEALMDGLWWTSTRHISATDFTVTKLPVAKKEILAYVFTFEQSSFSQRPQSEIGSVFVTFTSESGNELAEVNKMYLESVAPTN